MSLKFEFSDSVGEKAIIDKYNRCKTQKLFALSILASITKLKMLFNPQPLRNAVKRTLLRRIALPLQVQNTHINSFELFQIFSYPRQYLYRSSEPFRLFSRIATCEHSIETSLSSSNRTAAVSNIFTQHRSWRKS